MKQLGLLQLTSAQPGTLLGTGAGGLGWLGGAALGVKLAKRQDFVCGMYDQIRMRL